MAPMGWRTRYEPGGGAGGAGGGAVRRGGGGWRGLLDGAPEDWQLALELKRDLKAGYHYPDSDPRFRRAARHLPDAAWLEHYAALYAFHGSDLVAIDARARALLEVWPGEPRLHAILGDVARQRRDWVEAADRFERAKALEPGVPEHGLKAVAARRFRALAAAGWAEAGGLGVFAVNLDRNPERMVELGRQFAGVAVQRVAGVEGGRLSGAAVRRLTGDAGSPRGTLGCFLSHAAAWESFLAGSWSHGLFLEDDVIPLLAVPGGVGALPAGGVRALLRERSDGAARGGGAGDGGAAAGCGDAGVSSGG